MAAAESDRGSVTAMRRSGFALFASLVALLGLAAACGGSDDTAAATEPLKVGAIPDQDPEILQRRFDLVSDHLAEELGVEVEYVPVTDYLGAVTGFSVGDLDLVWFGGLTGVQARLEVDGAQAIVQRDIDEVFTSVFVAAADAGIAPIDDTDGLSALAGTSLAFGSESSTSGRLMPSFFLVEAGLDPAADFDGEPVFSGSHDATIALVEAGSVDVGALNSQVWDARVADGEVDTDAVVEIFRTPTYHDYHWVAQPGLDDRYGDGFTERIVAAFVDLDPADTDAEGGDAEILDLFGAGAFIATEDANYDAIESIARDLGLIR